MQTRRLPVYTILVAKWYSAWRQRIAVPRKPKERKHRGVFEREIGSVSHRFHFVDVDGKRKSRCVGNFSDAVSCYEAEKVRIRKRIIALVAEHWACATASWSM
jgi:hypothetical protein